MSNVFDPKPKRPEVKIIEPPEQDDADRVIRREEREVRRSQRAFAERMGQIGTIMLQAPGIRRR